MIDQNFVRKWFFTFKLFMPNYSMPNFLCPYQPKGGGSRSFWQYPKKKMYGFLKLMKEYLINHYCWLHNLPFENWARFKSLKASLVGTNRITEMLKQIIIKTFTNSKELKGTGTKEYLTILPNVDLSILMFQRKTNSNKGHHQN